MGTFSEEFTTEHREKRLINAMWNQGSDYASTRSCRSGQGRNELLSD